MPKTITTTMPVIEHIIGPQIWRDTTYSTRVEVLMILIYRFIDTTMLERRM